MTEKLEELLQKLTFWEPLTEDEKSLVISRASIRQFDKNQIINSNACDCMGIVFVLSGGMRISLLSDEGREITLYRVGVDDYCVTTGSCLIKENTFDPIVTTLQKTKLLVIPAPVCVRLTESNIYVRSFIYETENAHFSQVIWVLKQLLFKHFDQRLAEYLIYTYEKTGSTDLKTTQEEIARDVNSAREVVARMLKHFEVSGFVEVKRGHIILQDIKGLKELL